jgi:hypothetical protein
MRKNRTTAGLAHPCSCHPGILGPDRRRGGRRGRGEGGSQKWSKWQAPSANPDAQEPRALSHAPCTSEIAADSRLRTGQRQQNYFGANFKRG